MASLSAAMAVPTVACATLANRVVVAGASLPVAGLPQLGMRGGRARCSSSEPRPSGPSSLGSAAASALAAAGVMTASSPVLALVDERMSTEGTGLSLGLSNNLLGWILLGVFALIWSLYTVYTSGLDEDEESGGLSL